MSRDITTSKITPINMKKFCAGPDDPRSYLHEPGLIKLKGVADPWVIATNGHYLVLIDGSDPDVFSVEEPLEYIKESICESVSKMLKACADCPPNPLE